MKFYSALLITLLLMIANAYALEKRSRIPVYVDPFYRSSPSPEAPPEVRVGEKFDELLTSSNAYDILKVRDLIEQEPERVTPMSMMVLAIRLYDTGKRDEAIFWFYTAKYRYLLLAQVVDMRESSLAGIAVAMRDFHTLVGPFINSYAFCDIEQQIAINAEALEWTKAHPYKQIAFWERLPGLDGNRATNLAKALAGLEDAVNEEVKQFQNPDFIAEFRRKRAENNADAEFCWEND